MHTNYVLYNIVPLGFLILLVYIFIDVFLDYFRKVKKSNLRRVILYSFIFYLISLIQIKLGGFTLFPQNPADNSRSFITTNDWFGIFDTMHFNIYFWSYSAIFYNLVLLLPFGIFLLVLFNLNSIKKAIFIVILSCLGIDLFRLLFGWFGLANRNLGNMDIIYLIFNILGGIFGLLLVKFAVKIIHSYKYTSEAKQ